MCAAGEITYDILQSQGALEILTVTKSGFIYAIWQFVYVLSAFL